MVLSFAVFLLLLLLSGQGVCSSRRPFCRGTYSRFVKPTCFRRRRVNAIVTPVGFNVGVFLAVNHDRLHATLSARPPTVVQVGGSPARSVYKINAYAMHFSFNEDRSFLCKSKMKKTPSGKSRDVNIRQSLGNLRAATPSAKCCDTALWIHACVRVSKVYTYRDVRNVSRGYKYLRTPVFIRCLRCSKGKALAMNANRACVRCTK